jgi:hypothetical protein
MLVLFSSCEPDYSIKFKYVPGDMVTHKISKYKILITDTIRTCGCAGEGKIKYMGINSKEELKQYREIELTK